MSPLLLVIALLMLVYFLYTFATSKPTKNFPPGPIRLPVVGSYLQILKENYTYPHIALDNMRRQYNTPLVGMYLGDYPMVIACTYETCREIFNRPEFQGRVDGLVPRARGFGSRLGIFFDSGPDWLHQRRYSLRKMRDFGFGRRSDKFEHVMDEEVRDFVEEAKELCRQGQHVDMPDIFYPVMLNCIYELLLGIRLPYNQRETLKEFGRMLMKFQNSTDALGRFISVVPLARHVMPDSTTGYGDLSECCREMWDFAKKHVQEHKKTYQGDCLRDFVDTYLSDMEQSASFTEEHLIMCMLDLIFPATAAAATVAIALMHAMDHPEVLRKCREEIDMVVGRGRLPSLSDRQFLPYTEATLRETLRKITIAPLGVIHQCTENTKFFGYDIPEGTLMVTNLYSMHNEKEVWGDPEVFRPERFLDHRGNIKKKDYSLPFGLGKRVCAGETFARQNMFVTMAALFQNFDAEPVSTYNVDHLKSGFIMNPQSDFVVRLTQRE